MIAFDNAYCTSYGCANKKESNMTDSKEQTVAAPAKPTKPEGSSVEFVPYAATDKIRLTARMVRDFVAVPTKSGALPSEAQCIKFIMLCQGKRANPWENDVFLLGYDTQDGAKFSMVCGIELFEKRAEHAADYEGCESGVIVQRGEEVLERAGLIVLQSEKLIGGWAKVYRKDRKVPEYKTVMLEVYNTGYSRWKKDPAGMIAKVAKSQALRAAYPTALGGLYTAEEMRELTETAGATGSPQEIQMPRAKDPEPKIPDDRKPAPVTDNIDDLLLRTSKQATNEEWSEVAGDRTFDQVIKQVNPEGKQQIINELVKRHQTREAAKPKPTNGKLL
jgi:phage recombination protein Bet